MSARLITRSTRKLTFTHEGEQFLIYARRFLAEWEGAIDGREPPVEIDVELGSARRLQLVVDYGKNLDYGDRLHLVEARFTK